MKTIVDYDVIIIGSGPAGMNACLYASRANLKTLVIERNYPGGKIVKTKKIENWLGIQSIEGPELALQMFKHSFSHGGTYEQNNVLDIIDKNEYKEVVLQDKKYTCYAVIICSGTSERKIGIKGEERFYGKGISYCPVCDASLYKNKRIVVIGESDHAVEETLYLSNFSSDIIFVCEKEILRINENLNKSMKDKGIKILYKSKVVEITGNEYVDKIIIEREDGEKEEIGVSVVFPLIGSSPDTLFASRMKIVDDKNYIEVNEFQETKIKGVFAAGDCTNKPLKQIITASSDGAVAAIEAYKYINKLNNKK